MTSAILKDAIGNAITTTNSEMLQDPRLAQSWTVMAYMRHRWPAQADSEEPELKAIAVREILHRYWMDYLDTVILDLKDSKVSQRSKVTILKQIGWSGIRYGLAFAREPIKKAVYAEWVQSLTKIRGFLQCLVGDWATGIDMDEWSCELQHAHFHNDRCDLLTSVRVMMALERKETSLCAVEKALANPSFRRAEWDEVMERAKAELHSQADLPGKEGMIDLLNQVTKTVAKNRGFFDVPVRSTAAGWLDPVKGALASIWADNEYVLEKQARECCEKEMRNLELKTNEWQQRTRKWKQVALIITSVLLVGIGVWQWIQFDAWWGQPHVIEMAGEIDAVAQQWSEWELVVESLKWGEFIRRLWAPLLIFGLMIVTVGVADWPIELGYNRRREPLQELIHNPNKCMEQAIRSGRIPLPVQLLSDAHSWKRCSQESLSPVTEKQTELDMPVEHPDHSPRTG